MYASGPAMPIMAVRRSFPMPGGPSLPSIPEGDLNSPTSPVKAAAGGGALAAETSRSNMEMASILRQLQAEQAALREEVQRHSSTMEQMQHDSSTALSERDRAWNELRRVRSALDARADSLDQFVVNTHLLPKTQSTIPDALPEMHPWATRHTDPGVVSRSFDSVDQLRQRSSLQGTGYHSEPLRSDPAVAPAASGASPPQRRLGAAARGHHRSPTSASPAVAGDRGGPKARKGWGVGPHPPPKAPSYAKKKVVGMGRPGELLPRTMHTGSVNRR